MKALLLILALGLCSCSTPRFDKAWAEALTETPLADEGSVAGAWEGSWTSAHNGHEGALKLLIEEGKTPEELRFWYWAQWGRMKAAFRLDGESSAQPDGSLKVIGQKWLGPTGTYTHRAELTPEGIDAVFGSKRKDHGTFELTRP